MNLFLLYGGRSAEHEVSISSAHAFLTAVNFIKYTVHLIYITKEGTWLRGPVLTQYNEGDASNLKLMSMNAWKGEETSPIILKQEADVVFPLLHGPNGEDGKMQGLLEILDVPYVGPGVASCVNGMDKILSKQLFLQSGIPQVSFLPVLAEDWKQNKQEVIHACYQQFTFPMYVKPANLGSSIGITEAHTEEELEAGIALAFRYDRRIVIEQGIVAKEVKVALLGNEAIESSITCEMVKETNFLSYEDKYVKKAKKEIFPAQLTPQQEQQLRDYAILGFKAIDGNGMARCDFFVTEEGEMYLNELNMIPGFSANSFVRLWKESGVSFTELIDRLIQLGIERYQMRRTQSFTEIQ